jgi:predicted nuclease of predicted toxin-antitoxin system
VLSRACSEIRLLLTEDKDFGELVIRRKLPVPGIVLLRVQPDTLLLKSMQLQLAIEKFGDTLLGRYLVIEARRFRSRFLPKIPF